MNLKKLASLVTAFVISVTALPPLSTKDIVAAADGNFATKDTEMKLQSSNFSYAFIITRFL